MFHHFIRKDIKESIKIKENILHNNELIEQISTITNIIIETYKNGKKIILAGNGGSAADAQHIAGELVSKFYFDRPGLPSIALTTDTSVITAISNDYGFNNLFRRQIQANGVMGDLFIGLSTSGNSKNILKGIEECKRKGIITLGLTGMSGGLMCEICDYCIKVPSNDTPRIQEAHIMICHIICYLVEQTLFEKS